MFPILYVVGLEGEEDPPSLAVCLRLYYVAFLLILFYLFSQIGIVIGEHPGFGEKIVLVGKFFVHFHEAQAKKVLPGENVYSGKMTYFLKKLHFD